MSIENLFQLASRQKFRFQSIKGELTTEQLWDLPLTARGGFNLDEVAKQVAAELKAAGEESFVKKNSNPAKAKLEAKLEIVKHLIAAKLEDAEYQARVVCFDADWNAKKIEELEAKIAELESR
jgi:hypothetical protein